MLITITIQAEEKDLGKIAAAFNTLDNGSVVDRGPTVQHEQPKEEKTDAPTNKRSTSNKKAVEKVLDQAVKETTVEPEEDTTTVESNVATVDTPPAVETGKRYTVEEVRAKLTSVAKSGKQKAVVEILNKFGVKSLMDVKEKDFSAIMEEAEKV